MSESDAIVVCGARAHGCVCGREPGHDDIHECADLRCRGQWIGEYGTDSWDVVRFPMMFNPEAST